MRLSILSDLHLSRGGLPLPSTESDIVILAGDISRPKEAIAWARSFTQPVLYVAGNHEFYGGGIKETIAQLKHYAQDTQIHVLDNEAVVLHGIRFLGSTLWTDFNLDGPGKARELAIAQALKYNYDFSRIQSDSKPGTPFSPDDVETLFRRNQAWLRQSLATDFDGPTVVITHHAPSPKSIHPRFSGSPINTCFVSNSEDLMNPGQPALWIHGHTHDSFDYQVNGTRVICNPRGYAKDGHNENQHFDPDLVVTLNTA
ncbi:metallophosphoesterase [Alcaligenaceae bacterium]|nr:metallophosphoesterase [Alcaligenaceae bacterium]